MRYAAIDIGSNAVRLLIADILQGKEEVTFKKTILIRVPLRLGDDAFGKKQIPPEKVGNLVKAMIAFRHLMDLYHVEDYLACATSAMREARNGASICASVKEASGIDLEIIGGQREASIIYASHFEKHVDAKKNFLYIDVGGGSTELSVFSQGLLKASRSFNLGAIRILDGRDNSETWEEMQAWLNLKASMFSDLTAIGTGGNINKLFKMSGRKEGTPLSYYKLRALYRHLNSFNLQERIDILELNPDRADVIIPAAEIYLTVMKWAGIKQIYVPKVGLVDGVIQLLIDKNFRRE